MYGIVRLGLFVVLALQTSLNAQSIEFLNGIRNGEFRRIVTMGTSLTVGPNWPDQLQAWLKTQTIEPRNVSLWNRGVGAAASDSEEFDGVGYEHLSGKRWALPVIKSSLPVPDVIFIEYAINDAYLPYDLSLQESEDNLNFIIDELQDFNPNIEIILMTMNNPTGVHAISRPNIASYYQVPRDVAAARDLLLIDHYPNWLNLFNADPETWHSYSYDGLHPNQLGAEIVIVPEIKRALEAASLPVIDKEIPLITWVAPVAITFGAALDNTQLNASASVEGTFSYSPASGTVLDAGIHTLTATFTPTDFSTYAAASETVTITVSKATPTITWDAPAAIPYGTALDAVQLNAICSISGTLTYVPPEGTVLGAGTAHTLRVTLTESANYASVSEVVNVDVTPGLLTIVADDKQRAAGVANPPLTASYAGFVNGDTMVSVPPTLSSTADESSIPGSYPIAVTGGSDSNYSIHHVDGSLTVADKVSPVIAWSDPATITFGTVIDDTQLNATAGEAGTFSYTPASGTLLDAGIHTLTATFTPADAVTFADASKSVTLIVKKAISTISWNAPAAIPYGTALSGTHLNATATAPGTLAYNPGAGTVLGAGTAQQLQVSLPESANYLAASATVAFDVTPAPLIIIADDKQRAAGAPNPTLTAAYVGFVDGDAAISTAPTLSTLADNMSAPGGYPITVTGGGDPNYSISHVNGTLTVTEKVVPEVIWSDPAAITFGIALDGIQLNASASEAGTFSYVPASGTMLAAGIHSLTTTFTPDDADAYVAVSKTVTITVNKATPIINWSVPSAITYGTMLDGTQLNATTTAPGTLRYIPSAGTILGVGSAQQLQVSLPESANYLAGSAMVSVDVTPASLVITADSQQRSVGLVNPTFTANYSGFVNGDTAISTLPTLTTTADELSPVGSYPITVTGGSDPRYNIAHIDGMLTVTAQQLPVITWSNPAAITFGTALDAARLNATADTDGTFVYTPAVGTVLDAGIHSITVNFTPTDTVTYSTAIETVTITVDKAVPTITWSAPAAITYGATLSGKQLNATTSEPGTLYYTPAVDTVLNAGTAQQLKVTLPESGNYSSASETVAIDVMPAPLTITANDKQRSAGSANPTLTASYSGFVNGDAAVSTLPALTTTADNLSAPGNYPITVTGGGDPNYSIDHVDGVLTVAEKEIPVITWGDPAAITYGTALDSIQLNAAANVPGTFSYSQAPGVMLDAGIHTLTAIFTPADSITYADASKTVTITVDKAVPMITWNAPAAIVYGTGLDGTQLNATTSAPGVFVYTPAAGTVLNVGTAQQLQASLPESMNFLQASELVTIDVTPAPLTITAEDKLRGAGQGNPPLTAHYSGFVNGDAAIGTLPTLSTSADNLSAPGGYPIILTGGSDSNYSITLINGALTVAEKGTPVITWANPEAITYGTALDNTQLNASANEAGTFSYSPAIGTVLDAGIHTLVATFTPADTATYADSQKAVTIAVAKVTPVITWSAPAAITYGVALNGSQLNATTTAPGTLAYTPGSGTVLNAGTAQQLQVFLPESANYTAISESVTIDVTPAPLTITADDKQRGAGLSNPPLTARYFGMVNGDTAIAAAPTLSTPAGPSSAAGYYAILVAGGSDPNYTIIRASGTLAIAERESPVITWGDPAAITYGTALDSIQLNAAANVPGTFSYSPAIGTVLNAGDSTLNATFTPADTGRYSMVSDTATITVNKATTAITWNAPAAIDYGAALGSTQLNATTSAPGTLAYTPAAGVVLNVGVAQPLQVSLPESDNFLAASAMVNIDVVAAPLTITADDKQRPAGQSNPALTADYTGFVNGDTAVATPSTLSTTAEVSSVPGDYPITVSGGSDPNYTITRVNGTLSIAEKVIPVITWNAPATIVFGTALGGSQLNAAANVEGAFSYSSGSGTMLNAGVHTLTATFTPADTASYASASATVSITVNKVTPTISWSDPAAIVFGSELSATELNASANVAGSFSYIPAAEQVLDAGMHTLTAEFTPVDTANYAMGTKAVTITVNKAAPALTWTPSSITFGAALGVDQLNAEARVPGAFTYTPALGAMLDAGTPALSVEFTPADATNYSIVTDSVLLTVNKANPVVMWSHPQAMTYGTSLSQTQLNATTTAPGTLVFAPAAGIVLNAGSAQQLKVSLPESANFVEANETVLIDVAPAPLTIAAVNKQRGAGLDNPPLTASYSGFVNGDAAISTPPTLATTAVKTSAPGNYPITLTGGSDPNYSINHVNGTLTVTAKEIPVIMWAVPTPISSDTPLGQEQLNAAVAGVRGGFVYTPAPGTLLEAGAHTLTVEFTPLDTNRYAKTTATVTITVNAGASRLRNEGNPEDVFADGVIDLRDISVALILLNSRATSDQTYPDAGLYPDVDGDRRVTLLDVDAVARKLPEEILDTLLLTQALRGNRGPRIEHVDLNVGGFALSFTGEGGKLYDVQYADGSSNQGLIWETVKSGLSGIIEFEDDDSIRRSRSQAFYRLVVQVGKSDIDKNGVLESKDIDMLAAALRRGDSDPMFDLTEDGTVNFSDLKFLVEDESSLNTWLGDMNLDGAVDLLDIFVWLQEYRKQQANTFWSDGDFDGDGMTGYSDFAFLAANFGKHRASKLNLNGVLWQNSTLREDVDANGAVTASDMVTIIGELNRLGQLDVVNGSPSPLPISTAGSSPPPFVDPDGDGFLSPSDAVVVNDLLNVAE